MKKLLFILLLSLVQSEFISIDKAEKIAKNIVTLNYSNIDNIKIESIITIEEASIPLIYAININEKGFILIAADDRVYPLLGYSFNNNYSNNNQPIQFTDMISFFKKQIIYVISNNIDSDKKIKDDWDYYLLDNIENRNNRNVDPLMVTNWDQGNSWNGDCPQDNGGPGGNAYAGCVATATAMVMKYWNHPQIGQGSHSYNHSDYGTISVDFNTEYNWNNMSSNNPTNDSRKLLYHVGVSCEMNYGPDGSGAWVGEYEPSVTTALKNYFKYSQQTNFKSKDNYGDSYWLDIVKMELEEGRPLIYKGYTSDLAAGHAFVVDGYDGDYFHLNWGWSGSYNGNYLISNLSPGGYTFSTWQGAIFNLYPDVEQTFGCTNINACNYDENANSDNGSCEFDIDCFGICGGNGIVDECGECGGDGSLCSGNAIFSFGNINTNNQTFDINFDSDIEIAGFQFIISDMPDCIVLESLDSGFAEDSGFTVSCSELGIVIGFSFTGSIIPTGSGILTTVNYMVINDEQYTELCFQDVIVSNQYGNAVNMSIGDCTNLELCSYTGDVNFDEIINVQDIIMLVNMAIGQLDYDLCNADLNQDNNINIQDIIILVNLVLE